jgi:hypothetical protein
MLPVLERADLLLLPTDDAGRFCVRIALPTDRYVAHLETRTAGVADGMIDSAKIDLPVDLALEAVTLRFDPERPILALDEGAMALEVIASAEDDGVTTAAAGLSVALTNEAGSTLGTATTDGTGRAHFLVPSDILGAPGRGELRVSFAGNARAGASSHSMRIERRTHVDLGAPDAVDGRLPLGSPEDGIPIRVVASPRYTAKKKGGPAPATPTGAIEARLGDGSVIVGAGALERGQARVVATFALPVPLSPSAEAALRLTYVPDAPWFLPGTELRLEQPIRSSGSWTRLPVLLAGALVLAWLALARLPPAARAISRAKPSSRPQSAPSAGPHVKVVQSGSPSTGWTGRVVDAHDSFGVAGARVSIERRGFDRIESVVQTLADSRGTFALAPCDSRPGDELVADGPLHAGLRRPLPPPGELQVALVLRKRALLERLVRWARRRGRPFDARPEPTPGQVHRAAASEFAIARWADSVERAAYGGAVVDGDAQAEVDRLAPPDAMDTTEDATAAEPRAFERRNAPDRPRR